MKQGNYAEKPSTFIDLNEMKILTKFHANQRSLRGLKVKKVIHFHHFEIINFSEKFSWVFCIKFGTLKESKELYRMTPKSFQLNIAFKVNPMVII